MNSGHQRAQGVQIQGTSARHLENIKQVYFLTHSVEHAANSHRTVTDTERTAISTVTDKQRARSATSLLAARGSQLHVRRCEVLLKTNQI